MATRSAEVVVDTNVFGAELLRSTHHLVALYRRLLEGRRFVVSFETPAEIRFGALRQGWGPQRMARVENCLSRAEVVWPGPQLLDTYVQLRIACEQVGHGLAQRGHDADRWIAATALHLGIPLVSHDGIFHDVPGLAFETALDR